MGQPGMPGLGIHHSCRPRQGQVSECGSRGGGAWEHIHGDMSLWLLLIWEPVCDRNSRRMQSAIRQKPKVGPFWFRVSSKQKEGVGS